MQHLVFCDWPLLTRIMLSRFTHRLLLNTILLYKHTTFCLSFHQLMNIGWLPLFPVMNTCIQVFGQISIFNSPGELLGHIITTLTFLRNCETVFQSSHTISNPSPMYADPNVFTSSPTLVIPYLILAILVGVEWCFNVVSICISLCCNILKHLVKRVKNKSLLFPKSTLVTRKRNNLGNHKSFNI